MRSNVMAEMLEVKHIQLDLARKGLYRMIQSAICETNQDEKKANVALNEIIRSSVAVDLMRRECDSLMSNAEEATHVENLCNLVNQFLDRIMKDE